MKNNIEFIKNNKRIRMYGSKSVLEEEKNIVDNLPLTGEEGKDRLIIQQCIDDEKLKSSILYDGNTVLPFNKIVNEYRNLQKDGTLTKMSERMYNFFHLDCGDIAHYDIGGYRAYYNNSLKRLEAEVLSQDPFVPGWHTDLDRIFKELKIGKYYKERDNVNIDIVPLKNIKTIVEECGWQVKETFGFWDFSKKEESNIPFKFSITVTNNTASDITDGLKYYYDYFDKDSYIEELVNQNKESKKDMTISNIVHEVEYNMRLLSKMIETLVYKTKNEALILEGTNRLNRNNYDLELEPER